MSQETYEVDIIEGPYGPQISINGEAVTKFDLIEVAKEKYDSNKSLIKDRGPEEEIEFE